MGIIKLVESQGGGRSLFWRGDLSDNGAGTEHVSGIDDDGHVCSKQCDSDERGRLGRSECDCGWYEQWQLTIEPRGSSIWQCGRDDAVGVGEQCHVSTCNGRVGHKTSDVEHGSTGH